MAVKVSKATELFDIFLKFWCRNRGSTRYPLWQPLLTYVRRGSKYNYDLHWLDPHSSKDGLDGVSFYVTKYILKYDDWVDRFKSKLFFNLSEDDFKDAWSKFRPRILLSKFFGSPHDLDVQNHIYKGINFALSDVNAFFPYYISNVNGSTYPLSPYYQKRFLTMEQKSVFWSRRPPEVPMSEVEYDSILKREASLASAKSFLLNQSSFVDFDDIDDINSQFIESYDISEFERIYRQGQDLASNWKDF